MNMKKKEKLKKNVIKDRKYVKRENIMKKQVKGITLVALMITIIVLLILAGVTLNLTLGEKGIFNTAKNATLLSKIREIEEEIRLICMEKQIEEITKGKNATIAEVINDLKEKGYTIKEIIEGANSITGIKVNEENVMIERNTKKIIRYTLIYSEETTVRYFVQIDGKYYEIIFNNGEIRVRTEETNVEGINKEPEITVKSSDSNIIEANKTEDGEIELIAKDKTGNVDITLTEKSSNITETFKVKIKVPATSFTITPTEATIQRKDIIKLTATVVPSDSTDKITWSSSDENIATVSEDGTVTGVTIGNVIITGKCGDFEVSCKVKVEGIKLNLEELR